MYILQAFEIIAVAIMAIYNLKKFAEVKSLYYALWAIIDLMLFIIVKG